ncbi:MAG: ABC transporter permease [Anaerolineales bacterium]|jgi:spermidine/putrescine transport system permease protein
MATPLTDHTIYQKGAQVYQNQPKPGLWARIAQVFFSLYALSFYFFLYAPIVLVVIFSFNVSRFPNNWAGFTLDWYVKLFGDYAIGFALKNTLIVSISSTIISTIFGTMISVGIERYRFRGKAPLDALLFLPIIIPDIAMAIMLLAFFVLVKMELGLSTIIISHVAFNIAFVAVIVRARMASIDPGLEEAASDLYANEWRAFWRVTFPLLLPGILAGALFAFTLSLDDYVITFFTSGPGSTTLPVRIYSMVKRGITPEINAVSSLLLLASMFLVPLSLWLQRKGDDT